MDAELEKIKKLYPGYDDVEIKPTQLWGTSAPDPQGTW